MSAPSGPAAHPDTVWQEILMIGAAAAALWALWHFAHGTIVTAMFHVWRTEAALWSSFTPSFSALEPWMRQSDPEAIDFGQFLYVAAALGSWTRGPAGVLLLAMAARLYFLAPERRFGRQHGMESLIRAQVEVWPSIAPVVDDDPTAEDEAWHKAKAEGKPFARRWAPPLRPEEWLAEKGLGATLREFDGRAVEAALASQLRTPWNGPAALPPYLRILYAAFLLKARGGKGRSGAVDAAGDYLGQASILWAEAGRRQGMDAALRRQPWHRPLARIRALSARAGKGALLLCLLDLRAALHCWSGLFGGPPALLAAADELIAGSGALQAEALSAAAGHAYAETALFAVYRWAKQRGGVLPSSEFLWLRLADKAMFWILNCEGRNTPFVECAGVYAHFLAEQQTGKPLSTPMVEEASVGLKDYLVSQGPV